MAITGKAANTNCEACREGRQFRGDCPSDCPSLPEPSNFRARRTELALSAITDIYAPRRRLMPQKRKGGENTVREYRMLILALAGITANALVAVCMAVMAFTNTDRSMIWFVAGLVTEFKLTWYISGLCALGILAEMFVGRARARQS